MVVDTTVTPSIPGSGGIDPDLRTGRVVCEYQIETKLGQGGFGAVFKAVHPLIGKQVAIKVLSHRFSVDPEMVSRFVAEARAVNEIRHHNIIDIFSFGTLDDGRHYYVMEYLEGETLERRITREGYLSLRDTLAILRPLARALDAVHVKGIAHRDLKAENVLLASNPDGVFPKLLDFGIAKLLAPEDGVAHKTRTGAPMGTPHYMSPEQCHGRDVDVVIAIQSRSANPSITVLRPPVELPGIAMQLLPPCVGAASQGWRTVDAKAAPDRRSFVVITQRDNAAQPAAQPWHVCRYTQAATAWALADFELAPPTPSSLVFANVDGDPCLELVVRGNGAPGLAMIDASARCPTSIAPTRPSRSRAWWQATSTAICATLITLIKKAAPAATSELKWGMPVFTINGEMVCYFRVQKKYVRFGLAPGATLDDADGVLYGSGDGKHLKIASAKDLDPKRQNQLTAWVKAVASAQR